MHTESVNEPYCFGREQRLSDFIGGDVAKTLLTVYKHDNEEG